MEEAFFTILIAHEILFILLILSTLKDLAGGVGYIRRIFIKKKTDNDIIVIGRFYSLVYFYVNCIVGIIFPLMDERAKGIDFTYWLILVCIFSLIYSKILHELMHLFKH